MISEIWWDQSRVSVKWMPKYRMGVSACSVPTVCHVSLVRMAGGEAWWAVVTYLVLVGCKYTRWKFKKMLMRSMVVRSCVLVEALAAESSMKNMEGGAVSLV